ncbi:non-ribosomal peptide synthetase [Streptomyces typhae]|uniref:non-ribosomal peptide synthetase n=1 Tax=Streptomyces typhae TaxID=2681492 RepID=UPI0018DEFC6A
MVEGPGTGADDGTRSFPGLFGRRVEAAPDAVAVESATASMTYRELDERADEVARGLLAAGVGAEAVVAVAARRTPEWVATLLGILRAGAVYLPLDTAHPAERLAYMVEDSGCVLVLADGKGGTELPGSSVPAAGFGELRGDAPVPNCPSPDRSAYVIYTSGSTGRPKGVVVTHGGFAGLAEAHAGQLGAARGSRVLQFASPGFDASVWELCMALLCGATLVLADDADLAPGDPLAATLSNRRITHVTLPPPVLATLPADAMPAVECLVVAGDATAPSLVEAWAGGRTMVNAYGPTETTVCATMSGPLVADGRTPAIGRAVTGARVHVLDAELRPVPHGTVGELYVSGPLLARGYAGDPSRTAARFVADVAGPPGARMYRTGDLATASADGTLTFRGRADTQVKIHGVRIETQEVAAVLTAHPDVVDAVVTVRETRSSRQLVAYVVSKERERRQSGVSSGNYGSLSLTPAGSPVDDLRAFAARTLPTAMVPAEFVPLERIPLTPNGKPDLAALAAPRPRQVDYRAPRSATEALLVEQFAQVLGSGPELVGVDDDFFAIGGDSIQSIQVVSRVREHGVRISARDVFERRTAAALAELAATRPAAAATVPAELDGGGTGAMPLTPVARWIRGWGPGFDRFLQAMVVALPEGIDEEDLTATLGAVLDHHDVLRSRLREDEVVVAPAGTVALALDRVEGVVDPSDPAWHRVLEGELDRAAASLDPSSGNVARFVWFDGRPGALLIVLHHLTVDGVSWRVLQSDLADAWTAVRAGRKPRLPDVGTSMRRWTHALAEEAHHPRRLAELPMWRSIQAGPDPLLGARRLDSTTDVVATVAHVPVTVPAPVTEALLTTVPAAFRGDVMDGLLAALALALVARRRARGESESSVLIRVEGHGREEGVLPGADLARTLGWFTTVYPVRLDLAGIDLTEALAGGPAAGRAVLQAKHRLRAIPDRGIGYGLLRHLNEDTAALLGAQPTAQVGFNYLGRFAPADGTAWSRIEVPQLAQLDAGQDPGMPAPAELDINASLVDTAQGPRLHAVFSAPSGVLARDEVARFAELWGAALAALARHAATPGAGGLVPSDVPLVPVAQYLLDEWTRRHPDLVDVWPLTPLQSGLLFHSMANDSGFDAYQVQYVLRLEGPADPERLRAAGQRLLARHPALRSVFAPDGSGEMVQLVLGDAELPWRVADFSDLDESARTRAMERLLADDLREHFDPAVPPLVRMTFVRGAPDVADLVLTAHHAVVDGWSIPLMVRELLLHYGSGSPPLPEVRSQRDFLAWRAAQDPNESATAWAGELEGVDGPTPIADGPREDGPREDGPREDGPREDGPREDGPRENGPREDGGAGIGQVDAPLSAAQSEAVAACAARLGVTVNTLVQTAWALLLSKLTGRRDVLFGAVVSGRPPAVPGVDAIVGMLLNTVPVRLDCDPGRSLAHLVTDLQSRQAALLDYHHHGLSELHRATGVSELFDTVVGFQSFPLDRTGITDAGREAGLRVLGIRSFTVSHYPLALMVFAEPGSPLRPCVQYRRDAFDDAAAAGIAARFARILSLVAQDPEQRAGTLDALSPGERTRRDAEPPASAGQTVDELLAARARSAPDAVAVRGAGGLLTYRELDRRATAVALALTEDGFRPGSTVSVRLPAAPELVIATVAVLRAGCCLVAPDDDADRVLGDLPAQRAGAGAPDPVHPGRSVRPARPVQPGRTAALLATWGHADGRRVVALSHAALAARVEQAATPAPLRTACDGEFGRWLVDVLAAVSVGGGLEIATGSGGPRPPAEDGAGQAEDRAGQAEDRAGQAAGEAACSHTETGHPRLSPPHGGEGADRRGSLFAPRPGLRLNVLDHSLQPAPEGAVGELYVAGPALGLGYHEQSATTSAYFVADPFGPAGARMFRTGERVRRRPDGTLQLIGRADGQVTVRGVRVGPRAVEAVLTQHPEVAEAAVVAEPAGTARGTDGRPLLTAYVVGAGAAPGLLAAFAAGRLPRDVVPDSVVPLAYLPRRPDGRVDVPALASARRAERVRREPRDEREAKLCALFADVLEVDGVGPDDNFFELGGTSLTATRLSSRIRQELGVTVSIRTIFQTTAIADLARAVEETSASTRPALRRMNRSGQS